MIVKHHGNVSRASRELGVEPAFFRRLVKRFGLLDILDGVRKLLY